MEGRTVAFILLFPAMIWGYSVPEEKKVAQHIPITGM